MLATFGDTFESDTKQLAFRVERWTERVEHRAERALQVIGVDWRDRAKERVPVSAGADTIGGSLESHIFKNVYTEGLYRTLTLEVGTNIPYGVYVEFGTRYIAGGAVLRLGFGPEVTDAMAVKDWPAKDERTEGGTIGNDQQMPWLRPAWFAVEKRALERINEIHEPPDRTAI